jgi:hypothetical protein
VSRWLSDAASMPLTPASPFSVRTILTRTLVIEQLICR